MNKSKLALLVAKNFKIIIKERNITQAQAAHIINVDERTLRRYLHYGIDSLSTIENICDSFEITIEDLLKTGQ